MSRRRAIWIAIGVTLVGALAAGLAWFQPWKLFIDHRVDEPLPAVALEGVPAADGTAAIPAASPSAARARTRDRLVSRGQLISHEHSTRGTVSVVRLASGRRVLTIANLDTSDGPDVHVWLTDQRVTKDGWHVFDDGKHVSLGTLKGNLGNQVYEIPKRTDLTVLTSVSIWCDRFDVSFGAAELSPVS